MKRWTDCYHMTVAGMTALWCLIEFSPCRTNGTTYCTIDATEQMVATRSHKHLFVGTFTMKYHVAYFTGSRTMTPHVVWLKKLLKTSMNATDSKGLEGTRRRWAPGKQSCATLSLTFASTCYFLVYYCNLCCIYELWKLQCFVLWTIKSAVRNCYAIITLFLCCLFTNFSFFTNIYHHN